MRVIVRARLWRTAPGPDAQLHRVLNAARRTKFYGLCGALNEFPLTRVRDIDERRQDFLSGARDKPLAQSLWYPIEPRPRIAVLAEGFRQTSATRIFVDCDLQDVCNWRVETLAAPARILRDLARLGRPVGYPLIGFTGVRHGLLTEVDRRMFWDVFGVPVFEQMIGVHGEVIAEECEAHEGLHVRPEHAFFEVVNRELVYTSLASVASPAVRVQLGLEGSVEQTLCGCGRSGTRVNVKIEADSRADVAELADALDLGSSTRKGV